MPTLKIIQTADWQLGKPFGRFPQEVSAALCEAWLDAIDRVGAVAKLQGAGHVVVAGDVIDNVDPGNLIERFFYKLKNIPRVATRYDKLAANFLAMVQLASMRLWLRAYESTA